MDPGQHEENSPENQPNRNPTPQLSDALAVKLFMENMAELVNAGLPILRSLDIVSGFTYNDKLKAAIKGVSEEVEGGGSIGEAMKAHAIFPPIIVRTIVAGEIGGVLDIAFSRGHQFLENQSLERPVPFHTTADARLFALQLGFLLEMGTPILEAISAAKAGTSAEMQGVVDKIYSGIREGEGFTGSIIAAKAEHLFGPVFMGLVGVGEESGEFDQALLRFAMRT